MLRARRKFIKQICIGATGIGLAPLFPAYIYGEGRKISGLSRIAPEAEGISSESILAFIESVEKNNLGLHSFMVVRHGKVVSEGWWDPYKPDLRHMLFSLSKSFTSTAVGFAVSDDLLSVEDKVVSFFPDDLPAYVSSNLAAMRVKDLLTMNTGHDTDTMGHMRTGKQTWVKTFLSRPVEHRHGTFFLYNSGATYMLAAIVQKLTKETVLEYLTPRLFDPLQITGADWEISPDGINTAAYGLRIKTEDIAKFGQFYLQKGIWNGKRLLPEKWIDEATSYKVESNPGGGASMKRPDDEWSQGYCYQFWRCRHNSYRADGAVGQFSIVMPDQNAVVAITSETASMQGILNNVWDHLLAGMKASPLPVNAKAHNLLKQKLASLTLLPSGSATTSPLVNNISGKPITLQENEMNAKEVSFTFTDMTCVFTLDDGNGEHIVSCGLGHWAKGETLMPGDPIDLVWGYNKPGKKSKVAASGYWKDDKTFEMMWDFYETPHADTVTCTFENNTIRLQFKNSLVGKIGNLKENRPVLEGKLI